MWNFGTRIFWMVVLGLSHTPIGSFSKRIFGKFWFNVMHFTDRGKLLWFL